MSERGERGPSGPAERERSGGRLVAANGVELWVEGFGDATDPTVLLISGADSPGTRWAKELINPIVAAGYHVVRFDNRDSGLSTKPPATAVYTLDDLAADTVALLDALEIDRAHAVGRSMGGMVAQLLALNHADRVRTLALLVSSPGVDDPALPGPDPGLLERLAERHFAPPPTTRDERIEWTVELFRWFAGSRYPFDEAGQRAAAEQEVDRCWHPESGHGLAVQLSPSRLDRLGSIRAPTLIVHGTDDPIVPVDHAHAMAARIPDNECWIVPGLGHETPLSLIDDLTPRLLALFARR